MAKVECAVCGKEGSSRDMYYCSNYGLWVHFECAGGDTGFAGFFAGDAECPSCEQNSLNGKLGHY